jgi:hypothetical protein
MNSRAARSLNGGYSQSICFIRQVGVALGTNLTRSVLLALTSRNRLLADGGGHGFTVAN